MKELFEPVEAQILPVGDPVLLLKTINLKFQARLREINEESDREKREILAILESIEAFLRSRLDCEHQIIPFNAHPELVGSNKDLQCTKCKRVWESEPVRMIPTMPHHLVGGAGAT